MPSSSHETLAWDEKNLPSITHAIRTAVAASASVLIARLVQMPEAYWAAIATLVVMQSTLGATLTLSIERVVATAVGASAGALEANFFGANLVAFAVAIVLIGLLSIAFRLEKTAYRYASINPCNHRSDSAFGSGVDHRAAPNDKPRFVRPKTFARCLCFGATGYNWFS